MSTTWQCDHRQHDECPGALPDGRRCDCGCEHDGEES